MEMSQHKQTKDNSHSWNKQTNATMVLCHKLWWINITLIKCTVKKYTLENWLCFGRWVISLLRQKRLWPNGWKQITSFIGVSLYFDYISIKTLYFNDLLFYIVNLTEWDKFTIISKISVLMLFFKALWTEVSTGGWEVSCTCN